MSHASKLKDHTLLNEDKEISKVKDWKKNIPAVQKLKFNLRRESGKFSGFYQSLVGFVKT